MFSAGYLWECYFPVQRERKLVNRLLLFFYLPQMSLILKTKQTERVLKITMEVENSLADKNGKPTLVLVTLPSSSLR